MNKGSDTRKNKIRGVAATVVALAVITTLLAGNRLAQVTDTTQQTTLALEVPEQSAGSDVQDTAGTSQIAGFAVEDDEQVWTTETSLDIFKVSYSNGEGTVTVLGSDNEKVFAPGTSNTYVFNVENSGTFAVDYHMTVEAYVGNEEYTLPIEARFSDHNGKYFVGSESAWSPVLELDGIEDTAVLGSNSYAKYTLEWEWPYEGDDVETDDAYDTMLGNLAAAGEDLTLTIVIRVTATADADASAVGGLPKTGDYSSVIVWAVIAVAAFAVILFLVFLFVGRRKTEHEKKPKAGAYIDEKHNGS
ncbi:MAG: hypothetical protein LUC83_01190 [Clostridiales bacterium]|nr:hypothetical protein [Clostridiales bacterium]